MNYRYKAPISLLLDLWLFPPTAALALLGALYAPHPVLASVLALLPTGVLLLAIGQAMATGSRKLPPWAWAYDTPDSPTSPYSDYEPAAIPYYRFGRLIGDYLWLAWRNRWYGLAFHWGVDILPRDAIECIGSPYVADTDPSGAHIYGINRIHVFDAGEVIAWSYRAALPFAGNRFVLRLWFGWKIQGFAQTLPSQWTSENPAMLALQIELRRYHG